MLNQKYRLSWQLPSGARREHYFDTPAQLNRYEKRNCSSILAPRRKELWTSIRYEPYCRIGNTIVTRSMLQTYLAQLYF